MKIIIVYYLFMGFLFIGCQSKNSNSKKPEILEQEKSKSIELIKTAPKFTDTTNSNEIKQVCDSVISMVDNSLPKLKKVEKKLTIYKTPNTPVTIWYSDSNLPVKIEHAVTDDSREFSGKFQYYFINGQFWYSDQIFAKYIFDSGKLIYWMDEHWRINEISANNFKDRETSIKSVVEKLLIENQ